jgi:hypothetical protein
MKWLFLCAECNHTFEEDAHEEGDEADCPDCGEICTAWVPATDEDVDYA